MIMFEVNQVDMVFNTKYNHGQSGYCACLSPVDFFFIIQTYPNLHIFVVYVFVYTQFSLRRLEIGEMHFLRPVEGYKMTD
jgi:hypothetical protein